MEDADRAGARAFQAIVPMRDGMRLNTFVFLPELSCFCRRTAETPSFVEVPMLTRR
jgi:hypothetical protein